MSKKKIAVFTSIRSEYGLLSPLIKKLKNNPAFDVKLLVGGAHLLEEFGSTINQIKADGFEIDYIFDFINRTTSPDALTQSLGTLQIQTGEYLSKHPPELMIVLGDRFELLPLALSCTLFNVPIAHISGGEITEGAIDNQIRHALTKLSHLHFPATESYKNNIMCMGEEEWRICVSGEPGLDLLNDIQYFPKTELFNLLGLDEKKEFIICTIHPETISNIINPLFVKELLEKITADTPYQILTTASNFDHGGSAINNLLEQLSKTNPNIKYIQNLGQQKYYSVLKYAAAMLGNSSSGLVEAQSFNLPVINIGNRQQGRLINPNVYHCSLDILDIMESLNYVVSDEFKKKFKDQPNIYGDGNACNKIISYIKQVDFSKLIYKKTIFN